MKVLAGYGQSGQPQYVDWMRVLVTGSRDWDDAGEIYNLLDQYTADAERVILVHGRCESGADEIADAWGMLHEVAIERHPAKWRDACSVGCRPNHRKVNNYGSFCPAAGVRRNAQMVALGADICLGFIKNESAGATTTVNLAKAAGIPLIVRRAA